MTETRVQYRALVRGPASFLASPEDQKRGFTRQWSHYGTSHEDVIRDSYELRRSTETLCYAERWQKRTVILGEWVDDD